MENFLKDAAVQTMEKNFHPVQLHRALWNIPGALQTEMQMQHIIQVPLQFLQLVYGAVTGYLVFGDQPALSIYAGGAIVIAANLFLLYAQNQSLRRAASPKRH